MILYCKWSLLPKYTLEPNLVVCVIIANVSRKEGKKERKKKTRISVVSFTLLCTFANCLS